MAFGIVDVNGEHLFDSLSHCGGWILRSLSIVYQCIHSLWVLHQVRTTLFVIVFFHVLYSTKRSESIIRYSFSIKLNPSTGLVKSYLKNTMLILHGVRHRKMSNSTLTSCSSFVVFALLVSSTIEVNAFLTPPLTPSSQWTSSSFIKSKYKSNLYSSTIHNEVQSLETDSKSSESVSTSDFTNTNYSKALCAIVGGDQESMDHFFQHTWQKQPHVYRNTVDSNNNHPNNPNSNHPLENQVQMGLKGLTSLLEQACDKFLEPPHPNWQLTLPIVFDKHKQSIPLQQLADTYGNDLFNAYLEGCSVILNHCDELCPHTAALCQDLQLSFPYAYANGYLTPPASQAISAHADDRDVFVIQVYGQKAWNVYEEIPIPYPYPNEQVGKNGLQVPPSVLEGPCSIQTTLCPGDVLYIPRGHVHEACTHSDNPNEPQQQPSFHITIALATFDWSYTGVLNTAIQKLLDSQPEFRMAVPMDIGRQDTNQASIESFEEQLEQALEHIKKEVTAQRIHTFLQQKYNWHSERSQPIRMQRIMEWNFKQQQQQEKNGLKEETIVYGIDALKHLTMSSRVRVCSEEEQEQTSSMALKTLYRRPSHFREQTKDAFIYLQSKLMEDSTKIWQVSELKALLQEDDSSLDTQEQDIYKKASHYICDLSFYSFIRNSLEQGMVCLVTS